MSSHIPLRTENKEAQKIVEDTNPELASALSALLKKKHSPIFPIQKSEIDQAKRWNLSTLPSLWERIRDELIELGNDTNVDDLDILSVVTDGGTALTHHLQRHLILKLSSFIERYPAIIWLLYHSNLERNNVEQVLVATSRLDLIGDIPLRLTLSMIKSIPNEEMAQYLKELVDSSKLKAPVVKSPDYNSKSEKSWLLPYRKKGVIWWWLVNNSFPPNNKDIIKNAIRTASDGEILLSFINKGLISLKDIIYKMNSREILTTGDIIFGYSLFNPRLIEILLHDNRFDISTPQTIEHVLSKINNDVQNDDIIRSIQLILEDGRMNLQAYSHRLYTSYMPDSRLLKFLISRKEFQPIPNIDILSNVSPQVLSILFDIPQYKNNITNEQWDELYFNNACLSKNNEEYDILYRYHKPSFEVIVRLVEDPISSNCALKYIIEHGFLGRIDNRAIIAASNNVLWQLLIKNSIFDASPAGQEELYEKLTPHNRRSLIMHMPFKKAIGKEAVKLWKERIESDNGKK